MNLIDLWTILSMNTIVLSKEQMEILDRYAKELVYWNKQVNLISRTDEENVLDRHILHSLCLMKFVDFKPKSYILDIGTGGGVPGIPIRIANEHTRVTLVDSIGKKIKKTEMFAKHTGLKDIVAINSRCEVLAQQKEYQKKFDVIISRAVAKTDSLLSWSLPMIKPNGIFAFLKGGDLTQEINLAKKKFPYIDITVNDINLINYDYFKKEEKKVVVCKFKH